MTAPGPVTTRRALRDPRPHWRHLSRSTARLVMLVLTLVSLAAGMGTAALVSRSGQPTEEPDEPLPGAVAVGPLSIVLPESVGPWSSVPSTAFDDLRGSTTATGFQVADAWGTVAPGGLVVTVLTAAPGTHHGIDGLAGPFAGDAAVELPWEGRAPYVAGRREADGVRELLLAAELDDGRLAVLSLSGPQERFASGDLEEAFRTVRVGGGRDGPGDGA